MDFSKLPLAEKFETIKKLVAEKTIIDMEDIFSIHSSIVLESLTHHDRQVEVGKAPRGVRTIEEWDSVDFTDHVNNRKISVSITGIEKIEIVGVT
jgi:hypothetical protein